MKSIIAYFIISFVTIFVGGWKIIWGIQIGLLEITHKDFICDSTGVALRVNSGYYGLVDIHRFFDSPAISWILLIIGIGGIFAAIEYVFNEL